MSFEYLIGLLVVIAAVYYANVSLRRPEAQPLARLLLYVIVGVLVMTGFSMLTIVSLPPDPESGLPEISTGGGLAVLILSLMLGIIAYLVMNRASIREWFQRLIGPQSGYDPNSLVHTAAIILMLAQVQFTFMNFILIGGLTGLAEALQNTGGVQPSTLVLDAIYNVMIALLGVGYAIRRDLTQTLQRLGLRLPTVDDIRWGIGAGIGLYVFVTISSIAWAAVTAPDLQEAQNTVLEQLFLSFDSLFLGFLLAATSAIGEEILYRGALQPIFGILLTSVFFAILHMQYTLTPASILIFVVGFVFGWVRQRQSTTAAIITHFVYNFIPFLLLSAVGSTL